jgi:hypothetical protein
VELFVGEDGRVATEAPGERAGEEQPTSSSDACGTRGDALPTLAPAGEYRTAFASAFSGCLAAQERNFLKSLSLLAWVFLNEAVDSWL